MFIMISQSHIYTRYNHCQISISTAAGSAQLTSASRARPRATVAPERSREAGVSGLVAV